MLQIDEKIARKKEKKKPREKAVSNPEDEEGGHMPVTLRDKPTKDMAEPAENEELPPKDGSFEKISPSSLQVSHHSVLSLGSCS